MSWRSDRRSVLTGLAALSVAGCSPRPAAPIARAAARPELELEALDLSSLEGAQGGRLGLALYDAALGRGVGWRQDERFLYCSTFKMFLAAATLERVQAGAERLDRPVPVLASDILPHAPTTGPAAGSELTIEALCQAAVELSDNPAANILIRELGGLDALRNWYRRIGDQVTSVDRLELELNTPDGEKDTTTPAQTVLNLRRLFIRADSPLAPEVQPRLLDWMLKTPTGQGRIRAGAPEGWRVAHKTGTGNGPANDIGLAYPPGLRPVLIAVYYDAAPDAPDAGRDAVIAEATRRGLRAVGHG